MTAHRAEQRVLELLGALGRVDPPSAAVLAAGRESLWSEVADEMLSADLPGDAAQDIQARPTSKHQKPRGKPNQAPQPRLHRRAGD
jgi:hypothetical protein